MSEDDRKTDWKATGDVSTCLAVFEGEIDFTNSLDARDWLRGFAGRTEGTLNVDLNKLSYIDSSGLAALIEIRKLLKANNRSMRLVAVSPQVKKLLDLTQIGVLFGV